VAPAAGAAMVEPVQPVALPAVRVPLQVPTPTVATVVSAARAHWAATAVTV